MGKMLMIVGIVLLIIGIIWQFIGKLPGDIVIKKGNTAFFPVLTVAKIPTLASQSVN